MIPKLAAAKNLSQDKYKQGFKDFIQQFQSAGAGGKRIKQSFCDRKHQHAQAAGKKGTNTMIT